MLKRRIALEATRLIDDNGKDLYSHTPRYRIKVRELDGTINEYTVDGVDMQEALKHLKLGNKRGIGSSVVVVILIAAIVATAVYITGVNIL